MRLAGPVLLAVLVACADNGASNTAAPRNDSGPAVNAAVAENARKATESAANEVAVELSADDPGLAGMSPSRRRAYRAGFRDCSAGRYNPDPYPEAYRIGCGAAEELKASAAGR